MPGALFVVATPIGNLEDLTFRALRILKTVDAIAAEDTRRTSKLLAHYDIRKPLVSVREHNEVREAGRLIARIQAGESIALVTDAGTPGIADPGARLVRAVRDAGIQVTPIPGASAVATALSVSGVNADEFVFMGFPPRSGHARETWFQRLAGEARAVVFFEAPHRIRRTLADVEMCLGERQIVVHREITKIHEWCGIRPKNGSVEEIGEFTVVVGPGDASAGSVEHQHVLDMFERLTAGSRFSRDEAVDMTSKSLNIDSSVVKRVIKSSSAYIRNEDA